LDVERRGRVEPFLRAAVVSYWRGQCRRSSYRRWSLGGVLPSRR
jgi:hypothetical protein